MQAEKNDRTMTNLFLLQRNENFMLKDKKINW